MTDELQFSGKVAAVTGASSGIGQAVAEMLGCAGAHVFMCGRSLEPMRESQARIEAAGGNATLSAFDIRDIDALQRFVASAVTEAGGLHVMVNNAGLGFPASIVDGDPEQWREMLEVNVLSLAVGCQAAIQAMRETDSQGHIINISSVAALRRDSGMYGATKHAVNCINATLRAELEDNPIRVVSILPGAFATNFARNFDRTLVEGLAGAAGINDLEFDDANRLPRATIETLQQNMAPVLGNVEQIAAAVKYVITQPIEVNVEELVIRPQKSLDI